MITMNELVDLRMQQHIAHEIYRQQIMQRIPDPFPLLPMPMPRHIMLPPRVTLPGVDATLQNNDLWKQFHQIGTEMIITKSGRRMFPSMRLSLSGLEDDVNYCVLLEMVPIGDCRFKFSGSQWVPAGGAEPQSPQRMYLHPDSPATGSHWQAQPILFNKVKLTNNTLDSNGHVVLTSMHKYQPRIHVIRTSDPTQIPWAPQQPFVFPETEFVAVTAYQNDRITKLKIDNNPFAKGFRETGQSRCKRKMTSSPTLDGSNQQSSAMSHQSSDPLSPIKSSDHYANHDNRSDDDNDSPLVKRMRSNSSACSTSSSLDDRDDRAQSYSSLISCSSSSGTSSPSAPPHHHHHQQQNPHAIAANQQQQIDHLRGHHYASQSHHAHHQQLINHHAMQHSNQHHQSIRQNEMLMQHLQKNMHNLINPSLMDLACSYFGRNTAPIAVSNASVGFSAVPQPTSASLPISIAVGGNTNASLITGSANQFYTPASSANSVGLSPSLSSSSASSFRSIVTSERENLHGYYSPPINVDHEDDEQNERYSMQSNPNDGDVSPAPADIAPSVVHSTPSSKRSTPSAASLISNKNADAELGSEDELVVKLPSKRNNFTISAILGGDN